MSSLKSYPSPVHFLGTGFVARARFCAVALLALLWVAQPASAQTLELSGTTTPLPVTPGGAPVAIFPDLSIDTGRPNTFRLRVESAANLNSGDAVTLAAAAERRNYDISFIPIASVGASQNIIVGVSTPDNDDEAPERWHNLLRHFTFQAPAGSGGREVRFIAELTVSDLVSGNDVVRTLTRTLNIGAAAPVNSPPTSTGLTATLAEDDSHTFAAAQFNFADTDTGDSLQQVRIDTLPADTRGSLVLNGTPVTVTQVIPVAGIPNLVYTPAANVNGEVTFTFSVSDGTAFSTTPATATVTVTPVSDDPTGRPTVRGRFAQGQELTADTVNVADGDGLPAASTFQYQWHTNDSTTSAEGTNTPITGATMRTYTLTKDEVGLRIGVTVSYTDLGTPPTDESVTNTFLPLVTGPAAPLVADAGVDQVVSEGALVTLDASGSSSDAPGPLFYVWGQDDNSGHEILLVNPFAAQQAFPAPTGLSEDAELIFLLGVSDTSGEIATDEVRVRVRAAASAANNPPTGRLTIDGDPRSGQTLTANTSAIDDADGLPATGTAGTFTYQWFADDGTTNAAIDGATDPSYLLTDAQIDARISLVLRYTDDLGVAERVTSLAVGPVVPVNSAPVAVIAPIDPALLLTEGDLTGLDGGISTTLDGSGSSDPDGDELTYLWSFSSAVTATPGGTVPDNSIATPVLTISQRQSFADILTISLTVTDPDGLEDTATVEYVLLPETPIPNRHPNADPQPSTQTVFSGDTVTLDGSNSSDPDLGQTATLIYRWRHIQNSFFGEIPLDGAGTPIASFTAPPSTSDTNINTTNGFELTVTDTAGASDTREVLVNIRPNSPPTGEVRITGIPLLGATLTANTDTLDDPDGLPDASTFAYQWQRNGVDIAGATERSYLPTADDAGELITVTVSYEDTATPTGGKNESLRSDPVGPVSGVPPVVITGTPTQGEVLTADTSGIDDNPRPGSVFAYQWFANDGTTNAEIAGATNRTYLLSQAEVGQRITLRVNYTNANGAETGPLTSTPTAAVAEANVGPSGVVRIDGRAAQGGTLTADTSAITDGDGPDILSFTYQWNTHESGANTPISGETTASYTLSADDVGEQISVSVRYTDAENNAEGPLTSAPTAAVVGPDLSGTTTRLTVVPGGDAVVMFPDISVRGTPNTIRIRVLNPEDLDAGDATALGAGDRTGYTVFFGTGAGAGSGTPHLLFNATANTSGASEPDRWHDLLRHITFSAPAATGGRQLQLIADVSFDGTTYTSSTLSRTLNISANNAPTSSGLTATLDEDDSHTFAADQFGFDDADSGNTLQQVRIDTLPDSADGSLALDGTAVTAEQVIPVADIPNLVYTPATNVNGQATFTFSVSDGTDFSDDVATASLTVDAVNDPPSGTVTIAGTPVRGQNLTANTFAIEDVEGPNVLPFTYQWNRDDGTTTEAISGATSVIYTLTEDDVGNQITVSVEYTDAGGTDEGPLTSAPTAAILGEFHTISVTGESGTVDEGDTAFFTVTLSARPERTIRIAYSTSIENDDSAEENDFTPTSGVLGFASNSNLTAGITVPITVDSETEGNETFTLTLTVADGSTLPPTFILNPSATSARATITGSAGSNTPPTSTGLTATLVEDGSHTFAASQFGFADTDSGDTLQQVRIDSLPASANGSLALGGTAVSVPQEIAVGDIGTLVYTPVANANGEATFTFSVSDGTDFSTTPATATLTVTPVNDPASGLPTISGTPRVGATLTADTSGISDPDGPGPLPFTYQWFANDGTTNEAISNATSATYLLTADDVGTQITVTVSYTDAGSIDESLTSDPVTILAAISETVSISGGGNVNEGDDATFTVTLSGSPSAAVVVDYATAAGTATAGSDFTATTGTLTFAAGATGTDLSQTFDVPVLTDSIVEGSESFTATLSANASTPLPTGFSLGTASATATITAAGSATVSISGGGNVNEGDDATFTVTLSASPGAAVVVNYAASDETATAGSDFTAPATDAALTFAANASGTDLTQTISVPTTDDSDTEGDETFTVTLSAPSGGFPSGVALNPSATSAQATIAASDAPTVMVSIAPPSASVDEGNPATFTVTLSASPGSEVVVNYAASGDTAMANDFTAPATNAALTFAANASGDDLSQTISVPTTDDSETEGDETFTLTLSAPGGGFPSGVALNPSATRAQATIAASDAPAVMVSIAPPSASVDEGDPATFTVTLSASPGSEVVVNYAASGDTAMANDFTAPASDAALTFAANASGDDLTQTISVPTTDDSDTEGDETFTVTLSAPGGGFPSGVTLDSSATSAQATIAANDAPAVTVSIAPPSASVDEGNPATFTVTLSASPGSEVVVNYAASGDTAMANDFTAPATDAALTFAANASGDDLSQTISVPTTDDSETEGDETFTVTLSPPSGGFPSGVALNPSATSAQATIAASDAPAVTVSIAPPSASVEEGDPATFTVTLSASPGSEVVVNYAASGDTAMANDFTAPATNAALTFAANASGTDLMQTISVPTTDDSETEGDETFTLTLSAPSGGFPSGVALNPSATSAQATIAASDAPAVTVSIAPPSASVDEGNPATFTVTLSASPGSEVVVNYAASGDTAMANDFTAPATDAALTFAANASGTDLMQTISVPTTDDSETEGDETFTLTLSAPGGGFPSGVALNPSATSAQATIAASDAPAVTVSIAGPSASVDEGNPATFTVTLSASPGSEVVVNYATSGDTAMANDFTAPATDAALTFAANASGDDLSQTISVPTTDDSETEGDETFTVTLSAPSGGFPSGVALNPSATSAQATIAASDAPTVTVSIAPPSASVDEGDPATFTVTLSASPGSEVVVNYAASGDTAMANDFTAPATNAALTFAANASGDDLSQTISVPTTDDSETEGDETFTLTLSAPGGGFPSGVTLNPSATRAQATIAASDAPAVTVSIAPPSASVDEGDPATFTVTLSASPGSEVVVNYAASGDTAMANDFTAPASDAALTFAANASGDDLSQTISVPTTDDSDTEGDETFTLTLSAPSGGFPSGVALDPSATSAQATIAASDAPAVMVSIAPPSASVDEGDPATFTVTLSASPGSEVVVNYAASDETATAGSDFTAPATDAALTFAANASGTDLSQTISVPTTDDSDTEGDETFTLTLSAPGGGFPSGVTLNPSATSAQATIAASDAPAVMVSIAPPSAPVDEGDPATFTVTLSASPGSEVVVNYAASDETATAGSDFTAPATDAALTFAANASGDDLSQTISVPTTDDSETEGDETFTLTLSAPSGGFPSGVTLNPSATSAQATIAASDAPAVMVSIAPPSAPVDEGDPATFTVTLSASPGSEVVVNYATSGDTAMAGSDFTETSGTLTFAAGVTGTDLSQTFDVPVLTDSLVEGDESFTATLSANASNPLPTGFSLGTATATATIGAAGSATVSISGGGNVREGADATFTVTLSASPGAEVMVIYFTRRATGSGVNSATPGSDFTGTGGVLTFAAGATGADLSQTFTVPVLTDSIVEGSESFTATLSANASNPLPPGFSLGTATATATIVANDAPTADAGTNQRLSKGTTVTLDGRGSSDPDGDNLSYLWSQDAGPTVTLSSTTAAQPTFTIPNLIPTDGPASLTLSLVVNDGQTSSTNEATVRISVRPLFREIVANQTYSPGNAITALTLPTALTRASDTSGDIYALSPVPPGLAFNATSRILSGTPTQAGTSNLTYTITVADGRTDTLEFSITINTPPTGVPTISGTATQGETLTADTSGISDADGPANLSFTYQWNRRSAGGADTAISGATNSTYILTQADVGETITLAVRYTDAGGTNEGPLTSAPTAAVAAASTPNNPPTSTGLTATLDEDGSHTFAADQFGFADTDSGDTLQAVRIDTLPTPTNLGVLALNGTAVIVAQVIAVGDIGTLVYTPVANVNGTATFTFSVSDGTDFSATPATATLTVDVVNDAPSGTVIINGTPTVGETLTADTSGISDADGPASLTFTYQWNTHASGTDTAISGETAATYLLTADDLGDQITVSVEYTDAGSEDEGPLTSAPTAAVAAASTPNTPPSGLPTITGTTTEGQTLTADTSGITDADGPASLSFTYQWNRHSGGTDTAISGETNSTYTLSGADVGQMITVAVRYTDAGGTNEGPLTSAPTAAVAAASTPNSPPTTSGLTVSTNEDTAYPFTVANFNFADTDSGDSLVEVRIDTLPTPTNLGVLALSGTAVIVAQVIPVAGIPNLVYTPVANANGTATFTFSVSDGTDFSTATGTATLTVDAVNDAPSGTVIIDGTPTVGETLTANTSGISDADGPASLTFTYQWNTHAGGTDTAISGETAATYLLTADDLGDQITVSVEYTDAGSEDEGPLTSAPTAVAAASTPNNPPTSTGLTATLDEDDSHTFAADQFGFDDADSGDSLQEVRIDTLPASTSGNLTLSGTAVIVAQVIPVAGIPNLVYTPVANANGTATFTFSVSDGTAFSAATGTATLTVDAVNDAPSGTVIIDGTPTVGETLTANTSGISDADGPASLTFTYQWNTHAGGTDTAISGETAATYLLTADDLGDQITVSVEYTDAGSEDEGPLTSAPTAAVAAASTPNNPPTSTGLTATLDEDDSHTFAADQFGFDDADSGDSLQEVRIDTLPASTSGNLTLSGTAVIVAQVIPVAGIPNLVYTPVANVNGDATFTFSVSDGTDFSTTPATATLTVDAVNDAPSGTVIIDGTPTVGETLTANTSGISDADGPASLTFTYQWNTHAGGTDTAISGETAATYLLTADDLGDQITVSVEYTDAGSEDEGPLTSAPTAAVAAASTPNNPPTSSGLTATLDEDDSHTFAADQFGFDDADTGDSLAAVRIDTLPASTSGSLALNGTAVTAMQVIAVGDIPNLVYTPAANVNGDATFTFSVSDGTAFSATPARATVSVTAVNDAPIANAGADQTVAEGATVTLDGSGTTDPDAGDTLTYAWTQTGGTTVTLNDTSAISPTFTAPNRLDENAVLVFSLTLNDGTSDSTPDLVEISVTTDAPARQQALKTGLAALGRGLAASATDAIGQRLKPAATGPETSAFSGLSLADCIANMTSLTPTDTASADGTDSSAWFDPRNLDGDIGSAEPDNDSRNPLGACRLPDSGQLARSAFVIPLNSLSGKGNAGAGGGYWSLWGRGDLSRFEGRPQTGLDLDGDLTAGYLGLDYRLSSGGLVGVALSRSEGEIDIGTADDTLDKGTLDKGTLDTRLNSVYPYGYWSPRAGLGLWGLLGVGSGDATLSHRETDFATDLDMRMGALGLRQAVQTLGSFELALKADAFVVELESEDVPGLPAVSAQARRARLLLEASHSWQPQPDERLGTSLELGLRADGGDADEGAGAELGVGLEYSNARLGLRAQWRAQGLLAHSASGFEEWGTSLNVEFDPGVSGQGLALTLAPTWGQAASGGAQALWQSDRPLRDTGLAPASAMRMDLDLSYGLNRDRRQLSPFASLGLADGVMQRLRLGLRLGLADELEMELFGGRNASENRSPEHLLGLTGRLRF